MKILSVTLSNYGPFQGGPHEVRLADQGLVLVTGENRDEPRMESNGSGKSSIFDALDWCLFGEIPRGESVDSVVNEAAPRDGCSVTVELEDDAGTRATVTRTRGKSAGLAFTVSLENRTALDVRETQQRVEAFLGLDRQTFHAAVLHGQLDRHRFADATDAERMKVLTRVFQLGQIDAWAERVKVKTGELQARSGEIGADVLRLETEIRTLKSVDTARDSEAWEERERFAIDSLRGELGQLQERASRAPGLADQHAKAAFGVQLYRKQLDPHAPYAAASQWSEKVEEASAALLNCNTALGRVQGDLARFMSDNSLVQALGEMCHACRQPVSAEHVLREKARISDGITECQHKQQALEKRKGEWEAHAHHMRTQQEQARAHVVSQQNDLQLWLEAAQAEERRLASELAECQVQPRIDQINRELVSRPANPFEQQMQQTRERIAAAESLLGAAKASQAQADAETALWVFWYKAFGPKGLKSYVLDLRLAELTDYINQWVRLLTGGTFWVRLETQAPTRKGELRNKLTVRVLRHNPDGTVSDRGFRTFSGGEKQRISLAVDFGLASLVAARSHKRYDLLILDELFRELDGAGRDAVMEMLRGMRESKSSIFVVDHDAEFQGQFEARLNVVREGGRATLGGGNVESKAA